MIKILAVDEVVPKRGMVLPFTPLAMSFDSVNYYVHMPSVRIYPSCFISLFTTLKFNFENLCKVLFLLHCVLGLLFFFFLENESLKIFNYSHV
jgi:hypothetical protein